MNVPGTLARTFNGTVRRVPVPPISGAIFKHAVLILVGCVVAYPF